MPRIIKKYPNRRLYDTETSAYITLPDVKQLVLQNQNFEVQDARTGEDLTRSILLQIIIEEESGGVPMFSAEMLANIIRYYGHSMQGMMGSYLERSIGVFHEAQRKFQEQNLGKIVPAMNPEVWAQVVKDGPATVPKIMADYLEKNVTDVIGMQQELSKQAIQMFSAFPFKPASAGADGGGEKNEAESPPGAARTNRGKQKRGGK